MVEIEFSVMVGSVRTGQTDYLLPLLETFEKEYRIHVNLVEIPWDKGWTQIAKYGIFGSGPDVSGIGSTWIGSLAAMQTLRPFTAQEIRVLGGPETFFESIWRSGFLPNDPTLWAVPWMGDAMVIYYWKEILKKAGIQNLDAAVASDDALIETLKKLRQSGYEYPLAATTVNASIILHESAQWIWNAGGDIISQNGQCVVFNQPAALNGLRKYFGLKPYISPKSLELNALSASDLFRDKEAAVHIGGTWAGTTGRLQHPEWNDELGIRAPGTTYAGGTSFVIWRYTRYPGEAFELVRFLSSQPSAIPISPHPNSTELPAKREAIQLSSIENDVFHRAFIQAMQNGRSFPTMRLWGSIEDKLVIALANIWAELFANPTQDLDECMRRHLDPLAERLNATLCN